MTTGTVLAQNKALTMAKMAFSGDSTSSAVTNTDTRTTSTNIMILVSAKICLIVLAHLWAKIWFKPKATFFLVVAT